MAASVWLAGKKRKLVLYLIFLVMFVLASFGARPPDLYHQNALVEESFQLQDVEEVGSWDGAFAFLEESLMPQLYNEDLLPGSGYPLQLVSGYRIRQVRVSAEQRHRLLWQHPGKCEASRGPRPRARFVHVGHLHRGAEVVLAEAEEAAHRWGGCSEPFAMFAEETTEPFGAGHRQWEYTPEEDMLGMDTSTMIGTLGAYPAGGYIAIPRPAIKPIAATETCCAADVSGMCEGNTDSATLPDITCSNAWDISRGSGAAGRTEAACCVATTCSNNADPDHDAPACGAGTALKASSPTLARTTADAQRDCCEHACSGAPTVTCPDGFHLRDDGSSVPQGINPAASCCVADVSGRCDGNTGGGGDVACGPLFSNRGASMVGTDNDACCAAMFCSGNPTAGDDAPACGAGTALTASSATLARTTADAQADCCEHACSGAPTVTCPDGFHLRDDGSSVPQGINPAASCCVADVSGRCDGNTGGVDDVDCPDWQYNLGSDVVGTDVETCCAALKCSGNAPGTPDFDCGSGLTLVGDSSTIVRTASDSKAECCAQSCGGWELGGCQGGAMSGVACTGQMLASDTLTGATAASCGAWCASATRSHSNGGCCALQTATGLCSLHAGDVRATSHDGSESCLLEPTAALDGTYQCPTGSHSHAAKADMLAACT